MERNCFRCRVGMVNLSADRAGSFVPKMAAENQCHVLFLQFFQFLLKRLSGF